MRSYSVLLRHEPSSGNDRTTLEVSTKSSFSRFLSTLGSCWGSLRLPNLQQVWLHSPNLLQVWLFLPNLQQVWLTQDQLGTFPAALPAALPAAPSATPSEILPSAPSAALPTALYLPHKIRTHEALCVARKTAVFLAPKPLPLIPPLAVRTCAAHACAAHAVWFPASGTIKKCNPRVDYTHIHAQSSAI